ncbi:MAG: biotin/lipoyl-binding protein [Planctomycetes bacterium]|nr:biotin/lipoyl-binding protein [Planctomycetota bacterium]
MKKWIFLFLAFAVIAGIYYWVRQNLRVNLPWNEPKFGVVTRGDIEVPITAPGLIAPNKWIEIKSKASGEVIEILIVEGQFVKAGDVLIRLKKDNEERSRDRAQAELDRFKAMKKQADVGVKDARARVTSAEARLVEFQEQGRITEAELKRITDLQDDLNIQLTRQEAINASARHEMNLAQQKGAEAAVKIANYAVDTAKENIKVQQSGVDSAEKMLEDAEERLRETEIVSKYDAIVTDVLVNVSEVIQGGQSTFTGGTVVARLADVSTIKVVARVDEADYGRVHDVSPLGALPEMPSGEAIAARTAADIETRSGKVKITVDAFPDDVFEGVIERVEPHGRLNQGSSVIQFDVHVVITDSQRHKLPLGLQAQVEFTVESVKDALRVPSEAVKNFEGERGVWVVTKPDPGSTDKYGKRFIPYRFGVTDGAYTELIAPVGSAKPLEEQQRVYTRLPRKPNEDN